MRNRTFKLPPELDYELTSAAQRRNVSRGTVVREALAQYIAKTSHSVASLAADLVGSLKGPRDLSRSKEHLDGFGR